MFVAPAFGCLSGNRGSQSYLMAAAGKRRAQVDNGARRSAHTVVQRRKKMENPHLSTANTTRSGQTASGAAKSQGSEMAAEPYTPVLQRSGQSVALPRTTSICRACYDWGMLQARHYSSVSLTRCHISVRVCAGRARMSRFELRNASFAPPAQLIYFRLNTARQCGQNPYELAEHPTRHGSIQLVRSGCCCRQPCGGWHGRNYGSCGRRF